MSEAVNEILDSAEVACVILPLADVQLVIPASCVAEVLPWRSLAPLPGAPDWCRGTLDWHGAVVPVVDHEMLASEGADPAMGRCVVVVNRVHAGAVQPFYALVVHGIPRLVQVAQDDLASEGEPEAAGELLRVQVGTERLVIPDLAALERRVAELGGLSV